ncbi:unnamed protein product, partial [Rotaria sp. Silwood1]
SDVKLLIANDKNTLIEFSSIISIALRSCVLSPREAD